MNHNKRGNLRRFGKPTITLRRVWAFIRHHQKFTFFVIVGTALNVSAASVAIQLAYPRDRALPRTVIAGRKVGYKSLTTVYEALQGLNNTPLVLQLGDSTYSTTPKEIGLDYATESNATRFVTYPFKDRLVPFSMFNHAEQEQFSKIRPKVDASQVSAFSASLAKKFEAKPTEASLAIENGKIVQQPAKNGQTFDPKIIEQEIKELNGTIPKRMTIKAISVLPTFNNEAVAEASSRTAKLLQPFTITIDGKQYITPVETVGTWLSFTPNQSTRKIDIGFNTDAIKAYLEGVSKQTYRAPSTANVTLLDNQEVAREGGANGARLDATTGAATVAKSLGSQKTSTVLALSPIPPPARYTRTYSTTSRGMQTLLNDWVASHGGSTWGISINEIGGKGRSAGYSSTKQFTTASIYKLYVSYSVQMRIASGAIDPNTPTTTGKSVTSCLEVLIIVSDNPCGIALGEMVGWNTVTAEAHAAGFGSTNLSRGSLVSTPADTNLFLIKLLNGSLLDGAQSSALINRMQRQIYRSGLPAGSAGISVANKPGFIDRLLNDVGIIYLPGDTYVMSVYSVGGNWSQISNLASTMNDYLKTH